MTRNKISRRGFLKSGTLAGVGFWVAAGNMSQARASANEQIAVAGIGIGGKGGGDIANAARWGKVVAVCDIDRGRLAGAAKHYEGAKPYTDFRKLFEEMGDSIDAVTVSGPDHMHTAASLMAMRRGIHVYAQKPLTRTVYEARMMGRIALENKVCTQMGNQGSASAGLRRTAMQLQAGVLGKVKEIHIWTNRPIWPQGIDRAKQSDFSKEEVEKGLANVDWDSWIGPAPMREYLPNRAYHDFNWRGWWDFGTGALGDICCHSLNMAFVGLNLRNPASVIAKTTGHNHDSFPSSSEVTFQFPKLGDRDALKFVWYDGGWKPNDEILKDYGFSLEADSGTLIIGEKGYVRGSQIVGTDPIEGVEFRKAPEADGNEDAMHSLEWGLAIKNNEPETCWSNFTATSGPLTETVLAGNLAVWNADKPNEEGDLIEWDPVNMKITNNVKTPGLDELIKPVYRKGYDLD